MAADENGKSWDDLVALLTTELQSAGAEDAELKAASERASLLLPKLKARLVGNDGKIKIAALKTAFGDDGGAVTGVLLDAAQGSAEEEKVYSPEIKSIDGSGKV
jgi:hypothetical protein